VLRSGAEYGLSADQDCEITSFTHNVLTANASGAAILEPEVVGDLDDSSSFSGNDDDRVVVTVGRVFSDQVWPGLDVRYQSTGGVEVTALLTLDPGVELEFEQDVGMVIRSSGGLVAVGTKTSPILLTGAREQSGYWTGVIFDHTNHPDNALEYVAVAYGGGTNSSANLILDGGPADPVTVAINHCTFSQSGTCGVTLDVDVITDPSDLTTSNTFEDNTDGDVCGP
jgi:hypothetical protein